VAEHDKWSKWLVETRFGGDEKFAGQSLKGLRRLRDTLFEKASLKPGHVLLDVGAGDGFVAFGALEKVGPTGRVILVDISKPLLTRARDAADQLGVAGQCEFIEANAEDLSAIQTDSVDVVTTRSVLIFVQDKLRALREFYRVIRPGGRTALFETVNRRHELQRKSETLTLFGVFPTELVTPVEDLSARLSAAFEAIPLETMTSAGYVEYLHLCEDAGFAATHLELHVGSGSGAPNMKFETYLNLPFNPLWPTIAEQMDKIFTSNERQRLIEYVRPLYESGRYSNRGASVFIWAFKAPILEDPW
jgi:SAM-dependent methyltransferase